MTTDINIKLYQQLFPVSDKTKIDTAKTGDISKNTEILRIAYAAWQSLEKFRTEAKRCSMYVFGDQWGDIITDPQSGKQITEAEYIKKQGKVPLRNNLIRSLIRTVLGQFASAKTESICVARDRDEQRLGEMMSATLQANYQRNQLWEVDRRALEHLLITGIAVFRTYYGWKDGVDQTDVWTDIVNHNRVFFDTYMEDIRHWDCSLIGEIHDIGLNDVIAQFSDGSKEKAAYLKQIYSFVTPETMNNRLENLYGYHFKDINFFLPTDNSRCRVIEIWRKESRERLRVHDTLTGEYYKVETEEEPRLLAENQRRITEQSTMGIQPQNMKLIEYEWFVDRFWYFRFLSPQADVLREGETPYWHGIHPYSFRLYPFFDAEVHSFISDIIDQNRYINRLITMQDFIMSASAKGVLMFPEQCKPDNLSMEEIAQQWTSYNGIIYYRPIPGITPPQQIISNSSNTGAYEMLSLQMQLFKDISGVHDALQGKQPVSGTPASRYAQESQNSAINLIDILEVFKQLRQDRDTKIMRLQQQYYTDIKYISIIGKNYSPEALTFNPDKVKNIDFDLAITESIATPAYRQAQNELLLELLKMGQINTEMLLENGAFPFADRLLQSIKNLKNQIADEQQQIQSTQQNLQ